MSENEGAFMASKGSSDRSTITVSFNITKSEFEDKNKPKRTDVFISKNILAWP